VKKFEFSIIASGLDPAAEDFEQRFYDAGCDDAAIAFQKGHIIVDFTREAKSVSEAIVTAVRAYPIMNSRWDEEGNAIVVKRSISVGIATDTERGLIVPVIHNAHAMSFAEIAAEIERLVPLARAGKLDARAMTGGTITITNVGAAGPVDTGAPLINAPEACVVGFGAIKPRPTVVGEQVLARPSAWISIACDHRIVDGATAAQFMGALVSELEQPGGLVE